MIEVNYIWVNSQKSADISGHDVMGPLMLSKHPSNVDAINFWCLDKYKADYVKRLSGIRIFSIEEQLKKDAESDEYARDVLSILKTCLGKGRGSRRDNVTIKEIVSLYILYKRGGYTLDTNVLPLSAKPVNFRNYRNFRAPYIADDVSGTYQFDVWMMYAPKCSDKADNKARAILHNFIKRFKEVEADYNAYLCSGLLGKYYDRVEPIITGVVNDWLYYSDNRWDTKHDAKGSSTKVHALKLQKYYFNTHNYRYADTSQKLLQLDLLISFIMANKIELFRFMVVDMQADLSGQDDDGWTIWHYALNEEDPIKWIKILNQSNQKANQQAKNGLTPLHLAMMKDSLDMQLLRLLLDAKVDMHAFADFTSANAEIELGLLNSLKIEEQLTILGKHAKNSITVLDLLEARGLRGDDNAEACYACIQKRLQHAQVKNIARYHIFNPSNQLSNKAAFAKHNGEIKHKTKGDVVCKSCAIL